MNSRLREGRSPPARTQGAGGGLAGDIAGAPGGLQVVAADGAGDVQHLAAEEQAARRAGTASSAGPPRRARRRRRPPRRAPAGHGGRRRAASLSASRPACSALWRADARPRVAAVHARRRQQRLHQAGGDVTARPATRRSCAGCPAISARRAACSCFKGPVRGQVGLQTALRASRHGARRRRGRCPARSGPETPLCVNSRSPRQRANSLPPGPARARRTRVAQGDAGPVRARRRAGTAARGRRAAARACVRAPPATASRPRSCPWPGRTSRRWRR